MTASLVFDSSSTERGIQFVPSNLPIPTAFLHSIETDQCKKILNLTAEALLLSDNPEEDFIVGEHMRVELFVNNGTTLHVRDLIIFGQCEILSTDLKNTQDRGTLLARNVFAPGQLSLAYCTLICQNCCIPFSPEKLKQELTTELRGRVSARPA